MAQTHKTSYFWDNLFATSLPRTHLYAAGIVASFVVTLLVLGPSEKVSAYRDASLKHHVQTKDELLTALPRIDILPDQLQFDATEGLAAYEPEPNQLDEKVKPGDNLSIIFNRLSLNSTDVHALANANGFADELKRLSPGETLSVVLDKDDKISEVVYQRSPMESFRYTPGENGFKGEKLTREPETVTQFRHVSITQSLFYDGSKSGLAQAQIMQIANMFGWDIDFALDIQPGDTFNVLFEDQYLDGKKVGSGTILSADFTTQGKTYKAVRYVGIDGEANYYSPDGKPMKKAFLQAPLDFMKVTSNFNPNRLHPILKVRRPHRGVDYAAPTGTPVYAAGNGKVIQSGYSRANGNYVYIQHGKTYATRYLHLSKIAVKTGQTVKQRQVIGAVGATGYATGPHLHYEFLIDGVQTNPRNAKMPIIETIAKTEMARFREYTAPLLAKLDAERTTLLAALTPASTNTQVQ